MPTNVPTDLIACPQTCPQEAKIEKGIPLPPLKHPWRFSRMGDIVRAMEVGDSYLCANVFEARNAQALAASKGKKITRRNTPEGYRIWRIA